MRIMVILPAEKSAYPPEEVELRRSYLEELVSGDTQMEIGFMRGGSCFKGELAAADFDRDEEVVAPAREAEERGFDALMVHCVYDPGVASAREAVKIPVIGPGQATLRFLEALGKKFGILAPMDSLMERTLNMFARYGLSDKIAAAGPLNIPLTEAKARRKELHERAVAIGKQAVRQGAELLVPFGLALIPTHLRCDDLAQELRVPVLNPAAIGLSYTEMAARIFGRRRSS